MEFENRAPEWKNEGKEPGEELKEKGFVAGYKPPASYFNWWWNRISRCIKEIINKLEGISKADVGLDQVDNTADKDKAVSDLTQTELDKKVDKIGGKDQLELDKVENKSSSEILEGMTKDNVVTALGCDPSQMGDVYVGVGKIANNATTTEEGFVTDARQLNREVPGSFAATVMEAIEQQTPTLPDNILSTDNIANNTTTTEEGFAVDARQLNATVPGSYAESVATSLAAKAPLDVATASANGLMSAVDKSKFDKIKGLHDDANWTFYPSTIRDRYFKSLLYGAGVFICTSDAWNNSDVAVSTDGVSWDYKSYNTSAASARNWESGCYANNVFVLVGSANSSNQGVVMTSTNGTNWVLKSEYGFYLLDVCYGNGLFVTVGHDRASQNNLPLLGMYVLTSPDGINWTPRETPGGRWEYICYGNGLFVATGDETEIMTSPDGITWSYVGNNIKNLGEICFGNGIFVAVNRYDATVSSNGVDWDYVSFRFNPAVESICYGNGLFVAVGSGVVYTTPDGRNWSKSPNTPGGYWCSVCWGDGRFVITAYDGQSMVCSEIDIININNLVTVTSNYNGLMTKEDKIKLDSTAIVHISNTAPADKNALWLDKSTNGILKFYNGTAWVPIKIS